MADINVANITDSQILIDREELYNTILEALENIQGSDGTLNSVQPKPNTVPLRDSDGRMLTRDPLLLTPESDQVVNVRSMHNAITSHFNQVKQQYYTKSEVTQLIQDSIEDILADLSGIDIATVAQAMKRITDHINAQENPHGATATLFPGNIVSRDSTGQFEVGEPTKPSHVARYDTIQKLLGDIDIETLSKIDSELQNMDNKINDSLIEWVDIEDTGVDNA